MQATVLVWVANTFSHDSWGGGRELQIDLCALFNQRCHYFSKPVIFFFLHYFKTNKILHTLKIPVKPCKMVKRKKKMQFLALWSLENQLENWYLFWFILQILFLVLWRDLNQFMSSVLSEKWEENFSTPLLIFICQDTDCALRETFLFLCYAERNESIHTISTPRTEEGTNLETENVIRLSFFSGLWRKSEIG